MPPEVLCLKDYIVAGAAFVSAILGTMNTRNALNQQRVRLKEQGRAVGSGFKWYSVRN
jgi:hypothetical protein